MGLDVLSVRCHVHNISHSERTLCPLCEQERSARHAAEQAERAAKLELERAAAAERHGPMCGCPTCERPAVQVTDLVIGKRPLCIHGRPREECERTELPPVLQLPPGSEGLAIETMLDEHAPRGQAEQHVNAALARMTPAQLVALLGELELWRLAQRAGDGVRLQRFRIPDTCIAPGMTCTLQCHPHEPGRLIRFDIAADEGERALELVRVGRVSVGTRTIAEGGTAAMLNRCPVGGRETMTPSVGATLVLENVSAQRVTVRGVAVCLVLDRTRIGGAIFHDGDDDDDALFGAGGPIGRKVKNGARRMR